MKIALIGYGEVGRIFAAELRRPGVAVAAYDILFDDPRLGPTKRQEARAAGVEDGEHAAAAGHGADIVISAVTAADAVIAAEQAAAWLQPGQIFFDLNSVAPATKREAAAHVARSGADYVEAAVMTPVPPYGLEAPMLAGGAAAECAAALLNALGMNVTPVSTVIGEASATKLCRSIVIKGLEALLVECAAASEALGVKEAVFASFAETFPSIDWHALARAMRGRVEQHGIRRAAEMREAARMLDDIGLGSGLARAVAERQERTAREAGARPIAATEAR